MLKKLIKHDLKYGVRMFAVLHIILIIGCLDRTLPCNRSS